MSILCLWPATSSSSRRLNHPWLTIIHPGPWMHLPAAPAPAPRWLRHRPRGAAPNPFETVDEKAAAEQSGNGTGEGGASVGAATAPEEAGRRRNETDEEQDSGNGGESLTGAADARACVAQSEQPQSPRILSDSPPTSATCSAPPPQRPEVSELTFHFP